MSLDTATPIPSLPYSCGFEMGLCGIQQLQDDNFDWTNNTGGTGTSNTGPPQAYSGSYYMYTEVSGRRFNDEARFVAIIEKKYTFLMEKPFVMLFFLMSWN
jgi:hypothetical protein